MMAGQITGDPYLDQFLLAVFVILCICLAIYIFLIRGR